MCNSQEPKIKIKPWVIPLPEFQYDHKPYSEETENKNFVGRDKDVDSFVEILNSSIKNSGSYLVTGYRGAGKTSFVERVLSKFENACVDTKSSVYKFSPLCDNAIEFIFNLFIVNIFFLFYSRLT